MGSLFVHDLSTFPCCLMFCTSFKKVLNQKLAVIDVVANSCLLHTPAHTNCQTAFFKIRNNTVHDTEAFLF